MPDAADATMSNGIFVRPEFVHESLGAAGHGEVARRLTMVERVTNIEPLRKFSILIFVIVAWELYTTVWDVPELMFPTFSDTFAALIDAVVNGGLLENVWNSITFRLCVIPIL